VPQHTTPGVYVEEVSARPPSIDGVPTSSAGFVGVAAAGQRGPQLVTSAVQFARVYGSGRSTLAAAAHAFFGNGGKRLWISPTRRTGPAAIAGALAALAEVEEIGLVAAPGLASAANALVHHAEAHHRFALVDAAAKSSLPDLLALRARLRSSWAAIHHPWVETAGGDVLPPSGFVAGIYARIDLQRGVWKTPANEVVRGAARVAAVPDPAGLSAQGVNLIRTVPRGGIVLWGARTTSDDPEWKYVNVRRTITFLERSIERGTQWAVFEPSGEPLWQKLGSAVENFLVGQWREGALLGAKANDAFFVRCDRTTMTQADVDLGRVVCLVGCAIARPAEFIVFRIAVNAAPST